MLIWLLISIGMVVICASLVVLAIVGDQKGWSMDFDGPGALGLIFGILSLVSLICCVSLYPTYLREYTEYVCDIVSIRVDNTPQGSFFLGTGSMDNKTYYVYYSKQDKGYKLEKLEIENAYIIETNEMSPCIYKIKENHHLKVYYKIYVPENTIITSFVLE